MISTPAGPREPAPPAVSSFPGRWVATVGPATAADGRCLAAVGDAAVRLRTTDAGSEPATSVEEQLAVVFDGCLHNRADLLDTLATARSARVDDAALVRLAFARWGAGAVGRLKGVYAFLVWDGHRRRLFGVRDRTGVYPLFFHRQRGVVRFSTSAAEVASASGEVRVDRSVLAGLVAHVPPDIEETCYRGVRRLPAGHLLTADRSGQRLERYWRLRPVGEGASWVREEEIGRFDELLDGVVGRAQEKGPSAIFLSGGLDSVSIAVAATANARRNGRSDPLALSFFFPTSLREEKVQRGVAGQLGLDQVHLEFGEAAGSGGILAEALASSSELEAPLQNIWLPGYLRLARAGAARGCNSILTGRGGDEWLTMFPVVAADLIRSREVRELFAHTAAVVRGSNLSTLAALRSVLWSNGTRQLLAAHYAALMGRLMPEVRRRRRQQRLEQRLGARPAWLLPDPALRRVIDRRARSRLDEELRERPLPPGGFRHAVICGMLDNSLFAPTFEENYETGRLSGIVHHDVYWDPDLIEFLYRVPPRLLNNGGQTKGLVRLKLARRFPGLGFERQKKLRAREFVNEILLGEARTAWHDLGGAQGLAALGVVEQKLVDGHVRDIFARQNTRRLSEVWLLLRLESWVRPRV